MARVELPEGLRDQSRSLPLKLGGGGMVLVAALYLQRAWMWGTGPVEDILVQFSSLSEAEARGRQVAVFLAALTVPYLWAGVRLLLLRDGAASVAAFMTGLYGVVALLLAGEAALAGNWTAGVGRTLLVGLVNGVLTYLILHPATAQDVSLAETRRDYIRQRR
ncbi:hypothetical protein [Euzebya tangerina]|uniref:hypothetical protein n=1 Tax=Euzebya tangerina TaxID=591198 RepID=UPI000E3145EE|nr:hypothetical protein [Euzebya tangerina]